jgi:hypothetical protein
LNFERLCLDPSADSSFLLDPRGGSGNRGTIGLEILNQRERSPREHVDWTVIEADDDAAERFTMSHPDRRAEEQRIDDGESDEIEADPDTDRNDHRNRIHPGSTDRPHPEPEIGPEGFEHGNAPHGAGIGPKRALSPQPPSSGEASRLQRLAGRDLLSLDLFPVEFELIPEIALGAPAS